ncbi:DUF2142 domain-containing protein [Vreelandella sp. F11]|uniref:DUF2142 domain-containing protein n=1 Tax=Vreelandella sp. F11 TaxID=3394751 RepID=UPI0036DA4459
MKTQMRLHWLDIKLLINNMICNKIFSVILLLLIGCLVLSSIIPPLKSPDEHDHIERAYLLGKGVVVLDRPDGKSSGGYIDSGLLEYLYSYLPSQDKLSAEDFSSSGDITWSGQRVYDPSPGTGYYFPVIYLPQTLGLLVGEWFNLSVDHSYRVARTFALLAVMLILYTAFRLYPPNPLVLALIVIPMTLFQISSASLDGISAALAVFSISAFLRIANDKDSSSKWVQYALALTIIVLGSSRIHTLPLLILLAATFYYTKNMRSLLLFFSGTLFVFAWTFFALKTTVDLRVPIGESTSNIITHYLFHPTQFFSVVWQTLSNEGLQEFYYKSFFGILGWLDASFQNRYYHYYLVIVVIVALLTVSFHRISDEWSQRLLLLAVFLISVLFIFFALLVTWTPHPAQLISGVQGRYFLIPTIVLAYSVGGNRGLNGDNRRRIATLIVFFLFIFSLLATVDLLIKRYYLIENRVEPEVMEIGRDASEKQLKMIANSPLSQNTPISLRLLELDENNLVKVTRVGIYFASVPLSSSRQSLLEPVRHLAVAC